MQSLKTDRRLSTRTQTDLIAAMQTASRDLTAMASDREFEHRKFTAALADIIQNWCNLVTPDVVPARARERVVEPAD